MPRAPSHLKMIAMAFGWDIHDNELISDSEREEWSKAL